MSNKYIVAFRDGAEQEITARSVAVQDGSIQLLNEAGGVIAAFPKESVRGVFPGEDEPVAQDIVYTARDYAINHAIIPLIEDRNLNPEALMINVDAVADAVLVADGDGVRIGVSDEEFAAAVTAASE